MKSNASRLRHGAVGIAALLLGLVVVVPPVAAGQCSCDCDGDGAVTIDELLLIVNIAQGGVPLDVCPNAPRGVDLMVTVDELISCVTFALDGCPSEATPTPTASPSPTPTASPGNVPAIPTESRALLAWLQAGYYKSWTAESARHQSRGPHGTFVRTYLNDTVLASLQAGSAQHPAGAAVVKELYGSGDTVQTWAVEIKVQDDSAGGNGWYWWEAQAYAGFGVPICTGCHSGNYGGLTTHDFVLTPFPLQ
jgi:hypothetical protein